MAAPATLSAFLQRAYGRFPAGANRKHVLVLWDHGNGWKGYGVDNTCSATGSYSAYGCDQFTVETLAQVGYEGTCSWKRGGR